MINQGKIKACETKVLLEINSGFVNLEIDKPRAIIAKKTLVRKS
jgi:hypothetical protein